MSITKRRKDNTGYVEIDNPPVNAIGHSVRKGLLEAVYWAEAEGLERVIVSGKGRAFAAGADAREFDQTPIEPHLPDVLNAIDESPVPWIAAINGVALGGGAEIAMACRMRVMSPNAQIGLPEVTLGVMPGAGGTQRLPRLVGLEKALDMITSGKPLKADAALSAGLVHGVEGDPINVALLITSEELEAIIPTWKLPAPKANADVYAVIREKLRLKSAGQKAPQLAVDVMEKCATLPFHKALLIERAGFLELRDSEQAKALRHIFFAERAAKAPDWLTADPVELSHIAVVGGGTMGAGIAYAMLNSGYSVTILETDEDGVTRARTNVEKIIDASIKRGIIDEDGANLRRSRFDASTDYSATSNANLAIEAAFESMDVKKTIFKKLESALPDDAVLATNTSYLDINEIAKSVANPARVVGLHFFAPAHIMKLLEIVRGDETSDVALATGYVLGKKLRKVPVLAGVCDGFIGNRILARYREAADTIFMDGSTPWAIDEAMVEFGYAMGLYETQDLSGLDISYANRRRQNATRDPNRRYIPIADRMVERGDLGRKTGAGWYSYSDDGGKIQNPIVADLAIEEASLAGCERTDYTADEIRERLLLAMINEAAEILNEGIAQNARDIDLVTVFGYGFPRWRGGLMHYADTIGAEVIVKKLEALCKEDPLVWKISPLLHRCAESGILISNATPSA